MLLCNYVLTRTLKTTLVLPSASVVIIPVVLVIHLMPLLQIPLPVLGRRGWRVVLALAAVDPKQVNVAAFYLQLTPDTILRTLYSDDHDTVALRVPFATHLHMIRCLIVEFVDSNRGSWTLPLRYATCGIPQ
jgi:hypothetical protein